MMSTEGAYLCLISVAGSTVKMPVSNSKGLLHGGLHLAGLALPGPQAQARNHLGRVSKAFQATS